MCAKPGISPVPVTPAWRRCQDPQEQWDPAEPRVLKSLGIFWRDCWCWEPPKGAATDGAPLGTAVPLMPVLVPGFPGGSSMGRRAAPPRPLLMLAVSSACHCCGWGSLRCCTDFLNCEFLHSSYFSHLQSSKACSCSYEHTVLWVLDLSNSSVSVIFHGEAFEGWLCSLASF